MVYGDELFEPAKAASAESATVSYKAKAAVKTLAAPAVAGMIESVVSNRAEVQRFFGIEKMTKIEVRDCHFADALSLHHD